MINLKGKTAVVTGAGRGLGRTYSIELASLGAKVVVNDFSPASQPGSSAADDVVREIIESGGEAIANYDNVSTEEGGAGITRTAIEAFGTIDILINNAGIIADKSFGKMDSESWNRVMDVHMNGAYYVTKPAFAVMKEKSYGRIVFTSSAAGIFGNFGQTNYCSAKMGLVGLMNSLKLEADKYNIRINTVAPLAKSQMTENLLPAEILEKMKPEFVAPLVMFLCSDRINESGGIYNAGFGFFNKVEIQSGHGIYICNSSGKISADDIAEKWDTISDMNNSRSYRDIGGFLLDLLGRVS